MKRIVSIIICIFLFFSFFFMQGSFGAQKKKKALKTKLKIEFVTTDKFILVGDLYIPNDKKSQKPLIVMLHSFSSNASYWQNLAEPLRQKGYYVLAMDLRGHGRSIYNEKLKVKSRFNFTTKDWAKLPRDVIESIKYTKQHYPYVNVNKLIFIGADIGANAGILAGEILNQEPEKFVMLSPMVNFKGLYIPVKIAKYKNTKFLVLLSRSDKILFNFYTNSKPIIKTYPTGGSGNLLLKQNPNAIIDILGFIGN